MDSESQTSFQESTLQNDVAHHSDQQGAHCALCWNFFSPDNEVDGVEPPDVCGDCEIAYLANTEPNPYPQFHQRRTFRGRRARNDSSESIEDLFSQQFSHLINSARQHQHSSPISASEQEAQLVDGDTSVRLLQPTSSRTTPNGSRRWWRSVSDNESEDNVDSIFGERDFYSSGAYGSFHGEGDTVSYSAYGGGSDISVDVHSFLDREILVQPDDGSGLDSDTDIDPMHAGLDQWNSDDQEDDELWGEVNPEENAVGTVEGESWLRVSGRSPHENGGSSNWLAVSRSRENGGPIRWRLRESRRSHNEPASLEESRAPSYVGNSGDYLDAIGFEQLLEQLAEADNTRRGAPPAAASFVDSLPCVLIDEGHVKHGDLICAVCKDPLSIGTPTKQLPCMHLYHPYCILPWLSARNSCPLCRYELPTDDKDYEEGKQTSGIRTNTREIEITESEPSEDSSDDLSDGEVDEEYEVTIEGAEHGELVNVDCDTDSSGRERTRGGWFFFAATPIVSLVGIVLVFWFRNPLVGGIGSRGHCGIHGQGQQLVNMSSGNSRHGQGTTRNRRWWSFF